MTDLPPTPEAAVGVLDPAVVDRNSDERGRPTRARPARPAQQRGHPAERRSWPVRFVRGKESDAAWVRPALLLLLVGTAALYFWDLGINGWANSFYSAAVQAGTKSWKAMFFGSSDSSNFITVDKPPAFLWPMEISARIFGLNSWSMLAPQALEGVATVGLVYLSVRRWFSAQAALLGGAVVALTPVAAMMFRFNNPDAMLALLLTAATYATMRGLEKAQTKWLVLAGALVGFGFITKMMQAFLILPVMAVVYLLAAPTGWWRRVWQTFVDGHRRRGCRGLVGGDRRSDASRGSPLRRWIPEQQHLEPDLRLQRLRPDHGKRVGQCGWRTCRRQHVGPDGHHPSVQCRVRQHDVVAASRCARDGRGAPRRHHAGAPHRP